MLMKKQPERLNVTNPRRKKAVKKVNWMITVPPFLDKELREFIQRNNSSRINFIRKSIRTLNLLTRFTFKTNATHLKNSK